MRGGISGSSSANRSTAAQTLRDAINANTTLGLAHGYIACVPTVNATFPGTAIVCSGSPGTTTDDINLLAPPSTVGPPQINVPNNGSTIAVTAPGTTKTPASITFSIVNAGNGDRINSIRFVLPAPAGTVNMLPSGGYTYSCSGGGCSNSSMATGARAAINALSTTHGFTASGAGSSITLTAPTGTGSELNGIAMVWSDTGISDQSGSLANGVTNGDLAHTTTNFGSGANETVAVLPFRQNVGNFVRTNVVPGLTYPKSVARADCAGASCTYAEEMTNFANWFAYYRTRMQMAKTALGRSFLVLGNSFRVGFMTINFSSTHYLAVNDFTTTAGGQKDQWFAKLYNSLASGSTPNRAALARAGQYYGNVRGGAVGSLSSDMGASPITLACQPSYSILATDGYWNDSTGFNNLAGTAVGNQDSGTGNPPLEVAPYATKASGSWDGNAASNTLADVAMYYYKTDLRSDLADQVPPSGIDTAAHQHMTTFTVGMGLAGTLKFDPDYQTQTSGDFFDIKQGTKLWPAPSSSSETTLDDLWHAAVNGRGRFFSAQDPVALASGISETLNSVQARIGAGAAAATSNLQPVAGDNFAFTAQYQTVEWSGELKARTIDLSTGKVATRELWSAQSLLNLRSHTSRRLFTLDAGDTDDTATVVVDGVARTQNANKLRSFCPKDTPLASNPQCDDGGLLTTAEMNDHFNPDGGLAGPLDPTS